jgi:hypothetical protein
MYIIQVDVRMLKTAGMKYMRCTARCSLSDHGRNDILELKVDPVINKSAQYKQIWLSHISRM